MDRSARNKTKCAFLYPIVNAIALPPTHLGEAGVSGV